MTTPAKPARERLSEKELRDIREDRYSLPRSREAARECLRLRRALRSIRRDVIDLGNKAGYSTRVIEGIIARALASPLAATKGGR